VGHHSEAFVGIDTAKLRNAVAVAEGGRKGEVGYLGEVDTSEAATRRLVAGLASDRMRRHLTPSAKGLAALIRCDTISRGFFCGFRLQL
jgi:hypothetical protein